MSSFVPKYGVIGYGNMASAIFSAAIVGEVTSPDMVTVFDSSPERLKIAAQSGFSAADSAVDTVTASDIILLAVKPQQFDDVLSVISPHTSGKCVVSIAAGISSNYIADRLSSGTHVVRVMPNTPIMLGHGATIVADCPAVPREMLDAALGLFDRAGVTVTMSEAKINAATGISGSSPAYFFLIAEAMVEAARQQNIDPSDALTLAANAMMGAAHMLLDSGKTPTELREMVCSPNGTTLAALAEMERMGFSEALKSGMYACTKRADELGK